MNMQQYSEFEFELSRLINKYDITEIILITRHQGKVHHTIGYDQGKISEDFQLMSSMLRALGKTGNAEEKKTLFFPEKKIIMQKLFVIRTWELIGRVLYIVNDEGFISEYISEAKTFELYDDAFDFLGKWKYLRDAKNDKAKGGFSIFEIVELYFLPIPNIKKDE